ncbi:MAG: hypothetical protein HFJ27_01465 [Clostridia bacterium]|nr:hypothetical protein [Clostridia bacterium]
MWLQLIRSIILGLLPEVLFFTLYLTFTKNIKEKRVKLFFLITLAYVVCILVKRYEFIYYLVFVAVLYGILKILYKEKTQIIDVFIIMYAEIYLGIVSFLFSSLFEQDLSNYWFILGVNRIILFLPFLFKNKLHILYNQYCLLWNRNDNEKRRIKSITLRNISLIIINVAIFVMNIYLTSIFRFMK